MTSATVHTLKGLLYHSTYLAGQRILEQAKTISMCGPGSFHLRGKNANLHELLALRLKDFEDVVRRTFSRWEVDKLRCVGYIPTLKFTDYDTSMGGQQAAFPSTSQSAISRVRSEDTADRTRALELVIEAYWKPVYKYIRLKWRASNENAKDLTQGFFAKAIEKDFFKSYDPSKASFRTFLRVCLDRFVANENKSAGRSKRTSGSPDLSMDFDGEEGELSLHEIPDRVSMEDYFYQEWVRNLFGLAVETLRQECEAQGKTIHFRLFERYDLEGEGSVEKLSYDILAADFELSTSAVTNYLAYARREFRRIVLDKLRSITDTDEEFRNEARHLLGV